MTFLPNEIEITPDTPDAWRDVDVSAYIPAGASGVMFHLISETSTFYAHGLRKNGSTDARTTSFRTGHYFGAVGVDANRILEVYVDDTTQVSVYLVGYFMQNDSTFRTNGVNVSTGASSSWTDKVLTSQTYGEKIKGAILEITCSGFTGDLYGFRKNGSTDNRVLEGASMHSFAFVGVDSNNTYESYSADNNNTLMYLVGWMRSDAVFNTNAKNISLGSIDDWIDLPAIPRTVSRPIGGMIEVISGGEYGGQAYGFRANGCSDNLFYDKAFHPWAIAGCDVDGVMEGKIHSTAVDFFLVGYLTEKTSKIRPKNVLRPAPFSPGNAR